MKELNLLTEWADSIINEFTKDGNLPLNQDPIRQTQIKYPHLSRDEAASKYLDDITTDFKDQNAVINAQSKKSEKLEKVVGDQNLTISKLNKEIDDIESNSNLQSTATNDKLKQIGNIKKISDEEHRKLVDKIDSLQNKPGMTDERYAELMKRVDDFQKNGVDPQKIKEFERSIESMSRQKSVDKDEVETLVKQVDELKNKPNTDPESVINLQKEIKALSEKDSIDPQKFEEFKNRLEQISDQKSVDRGDFERLQALMSKVEQGQAEVERGRGDINTKMAAIEKRQADIESREKTHDAEVKAEVAKEIKRTEEKRKRSTRASYNTSKKRLDAIEPIVKNLPDQEELAKLKTLPAEIEAQKEINKHQDEKDDQHDAYLKRHDDIISSSITSKYYKATDPSDDSMRHGIKQYELDPLIQKNLDFQKRKETGKKPKNPAFDRTQELVLLPVLGLSDTLENILAPLNNYGNPKSRSEQSKSIDKARMALSKVQNDIVNVFTNFPHNTTGAQAFEIAKRVNKEFLEMITRLSSRTGVPIDAIYDGSSFDYKNLIKLSNERHVERHLPESLSTELDSIAENILGSQYAKYLK